MAFMAITSLWKWEAICTNLCMQFFIFQRTYPCVHQLSAYREVCNVAWRASYGAVLLITFSLQEKRSNWFLLRRDRTNISGCERAKQWKCSIYLFFPNRVWSQPCIANSLLWLFVEDFLLWLKSPEEQKIWSGDRALNTPKKVCVSVCVYCTGKVRGWNIWKGFLLWQKPWGDKYEMTVHVPFCCLFFFFFNEDL